MSGDLAALIEEWFAGSSSHGARFAEFLSARGVVVLDRERLKDWFEIELTSDAIVYKSNEDLADALIAALTGPTATVEAALHDELNAAAQQPSPADEGATPPQPGHLPCYPEFPSDDCTWPRRGCPHHDPEYADEVQS